MFLHHSDSHSAKSKHAQFFTAAVAIVSPISPQLTRSWSAIAFDSMAITTSAIEIAASCTANQTRGC